MRISTIAVAATLLLPLAAGPANACGAAKIQASKAEASMAQAATADYSAAKKKPARKPKVKVEYMRAAPM
jgi:hypothetical protein